MKAGRTLSDATRAKIQDGIDAMKTAVTVLETLMQETDTPKAVDGLSIVTLNKKDEVVVDRKFIEEVLAEIRGNDRRNTLAMETLKGILNK